jgi:hypothetical protein
MKNNLRMLPVILLSLPALACGGLFDFFYHGRVDMSGMGKVVLTQGDSESLEVSGPENVVPLVRTSVRGGVLVIDLEPGVTVTGMYSTNLLTFTIGVKDLSSLDLSGLADVEMDGLSTSSLRVTMSGSGKISLRGLDLEDLRLRLSGLGDADLSGVAASAVIDISGAGSVNAVGLEVQTADVSISGAGSAKLYVTERLTGDISGAGSVEYYGEPETRTHTSGFGNFRSLGMK